MKASVTFVPKPDKKGTMLVGPVNLEIRKVGVQIASAESEYLAIEFDDEQNEIRVIRHGMAYPDGGECVFSQLLEDE